MYRALLIAALLTPAVACASAQAKAPIEQVSLEVPVAPPRMVDPVPIESPPIQPVDDPATYTPASPVTAKPRAQGRDTNRVEPKPEVKPELPEPEPVPQPPPAPVPPLRTGTSATGAEAERQVKEILQRARQMLDGVDTRGLSEDRMANYESAKDSITRAEAAIKASNWVLARQVAERAENIAKLLISLQNHD